MHLSQSSRAGRASASRLERRYRSNLQIGLARKGVWLNNSCGDSRPRLSGRAKPGWLLWVVHLKPIRYQPSQNQRSCAPRTAEGGCPHINLSLINSFSSLMIPSHALPPFATILFWRTGLVRRRAGLGRILLRGILFWCRMRRWRRMSRIRLALRTSLAGAVAVLAAGRSSAFRRRRERAESIVRTSLACGS
jgi:hypothetical protein